MDSHERYSFRKNYLTKIKNKQSLNKQNQIIATNIHTGSDKTNTTKSKVKARILKRK